MVEWDITRYADRLPKTNTKPGNDASKANEASLRQRYPPLNGATASIPCIIVDMDGVILTWYLPGILTDSRQVGLFALSNISDRSEKPDDSQNAMLTAREKLRPLMKRPKKSGSWRNNSKNFLTGKGLQGSVNLSPGWFPLGHDVSASAH